MGYTHYFTIQPGPRTAEQWPALVADAYELLHAPGAPPTTEVNFGDAAVIFNGDPGYETFVLNRAGGHRGLEWFCKTEHRPYDDLVTAVLLRAKHRLGDEIVVDSDGRGRYPDSWAAGRELVARLWPEDALPEGAVLFAGEVLSDDDLDAMARRD